MCDLMKRCQEIQERIKEKDYLYTKVYKEIRVINEDEYITLLFVTNTQCYIEYYYNDKFCHKQTRKIYTNKQGEFITLNKRYYLYDFPAIKTDCFESFKNSIFEIIR